MEPDEETPEPMVAELKAYIQQLEQQVTLLRAENEALFQEMQAYRQCELQLVTQRTSLQRIVHEPG